MISSNPDTARSTRSSVSAPWKRAALAAYIAGVAALLAWYVQGAPEHIFDFHVFWWSAKALASSVNPYEGVGPSGSFFVWPYPQTYPLTAMVIVLPFTVLPVRLAMALFAGTSAGLLAFGLLRDGYRRLPVFVSASVLYAIFAGQWSPLLGAATMMPVLGFVLLAKPPIGLALFLYRPTRIAAFGCTVLLVISFVVMPTWPVEWWHTTMSVGSNFRIPILVPGGQLVLLALLRWKRADARLLLGLACVPQSLMPYEAVLLFLVASTVWEGLALAGMSWVALALRAQFHTPDITQDARVALFAHLMVFCMYIPALLIVLRKPNEGDTAELIERMGRFGTSGIR